MQIKRVIDAVFKVIKSHSGTICAGAAVVGVGATAYFSGRAAVEVDHTLEPSMTKKEKVKVYAKAYWKTVLSGIVTSGFIFGSDRLHVKKEVLLAGTAAMYKDKFIALGQKVTDEFGEEAANDIYKDIAAEPLQNHIDYDLTEEEKTSKTLYLYEPISKQRLTVTYEQILETLLEVNLRLQRDLNVEFNVFLEGLGGICTDETTLLEWNYDNESQNYTASYVGGMAVDFDENTWEKIKRFTKSNEQMKPEDQICLWYLIPPEESVPWE